MSAPPRIVVFDIGNVLVRWDMRFLFEKVITDRGELDRFLTEVCTLSWHGALDAGATYKDATAELTARFPEYTDIIALYDPRWQETIYGPINGSVVILETLRAAGVRTFAITNFPAEKFDETCAHYPFLAGFEGVIVSGRERIVKPSSAIFRLFLDRFGLKASDCVFIDDNTANVAAARDVGMTALCFETPDKLARDLRELGLPA
ncbi:MAG: HAD family phosphatase [Beijerinckiaceae bacterium]|nr:HAD family phosphatase [Beijerinckiaceae bacterium]